jgi:hypothetical protein
MERFRSSSHTNHLSEELSVVDSTVFPIIYLENPTMTIAPTPTQLIYGVADLENDFERET